MRALCIPLKGLHRALIPSFPTAEIPIHYTLTLVGGWGQPLPGQSFAMVPGNR